MVNWREDLEFVYALFVLVSIIVIFFTLYDSSGLVLASLVGVVVGFAEIMFATVAFESERARTNWENLGKKEKQQRLDKDD